jgi:hypothetical protein
VGKQIPQLVRRTLDAFSDQAGAAAALLDWIYLALQSGLTPRLDEIELKSTGKRKLVKYADKYPGTVRKTLLHSLALEHFAA